MNKLVNFSAWMTIMLALFALIAYLPGFVLLGRFHYVFIPMAPSTAFLFLILSGVLLINKKYLLKVNRRWITCLLVIFSTLFGLLEVVGHQLNLDLNYEDFLMPDFGQLGGVPLGRMSQMTGSFFFFSGAALLANNLVVPFYRSKEKLNSVAGLLSILVILGSLVFLLGYLYGTPLQYDAYTIPMAFTTALGFFLLGVAMLFNTDLAYFPLNRLLNNSTDAKLMRIFAPLCFIAVVSEGVVTHTLRGLVYANHVLISYGMALFFILLTAFIISRVTRKYILLENKKNTEQIKVLEGLIPICASCKKIRDDQGYWKQIEQYIEAHSRAMFSHGLCLDCMEDMYGHHAWYKKSVTRQQLLAQEKERMTS